MAKNARNMPRVNRLEPGKKHSRLLAGTVKPFVTYRSKGNSFPLREVGLLQICIVSTESLPFPLLGRESLMRSIALNDVTIILGETGSGKTTRMSPSPLSVRQSGSCFLINRVSPIPSRERFVPWSDSCHAATSCRRNITCRPRLR